MIQDYDFTAKTTGANFTLAAPGRFIYYLAGSAGGADTRIRVKAGNTGSSFLLKPGQHVALSPTDKSVDVWYISNVAKAVDIVGTLMIGEGDFGDTTSTGSVEVVDGARNRVNAGLEFAVAINQGAGAGFYATAQQFNDSTSKNVSISRIIMSSTTAGLLRFGWNTAAIAALGAAGVSKKAGAGVSASHSTATALAGTPTGFSYLGQVANAANTPVDFVPRTPILLPPGFGFCVQGVQVNTDLNLTIEFGEDPI